MLALWSRAAQRADDMLTMLLDRFPVPGFYAAPPSVRRRFSTYAMRTRRFPVVISHLP